MQLYRILIADDDPEILAGAVELLSMSGREVLTASDGQEALDILQLGDLHLALLDLHMPRQSGLDIFQHVRERSITIPCLFWSGEATETTAQWLIDEGAAGFLRKPVKPNELRACVTKTLEQHWGLAS
jgi:DNA-binding response OmpR family regulator